MRGAIVGSLALSQYFEREFRLTNQLVCIGESAVARLGQMRSRPLIGDNTSTGPEFDATKLYSDVLALGWRA